ncbi:MAG: hypothetical protein IH602_00885 [Bryobacteraceae bacterium]|nr:hypothetical protein [Bryobacteraceae bacterium]
MRGVQDFDHSAFIDQICKAICSAWATWQASATLVGVVVNGVTASGGTVVGPPWAPLILAQGPKTLTGLKLAQNVATGIGGAWLQLVASIKVPGLPWYPAFAAVPSPVAPPMPNIPVPIVTLTMASSLVSKMALKSAMVSKHSGASIVDQNLYEALAEAFEQAFQLWKVSTMVTNVLGTGPVPTFAPPYVPVGPVIGGTGTMTPGGFV